MALCLQGVYRSASSCPGGSKKSFGCKAGTYTSPLYCSKFISGYQLEKHELYVSRLSELPSDRLVKKAFYPRSFNSFHSGIVKADMSYGLYRLSRLACTSMFQKAIQGIGQAGQDCLTRQTSTHLCTSNDLSQRTSEDS